MSKSAPILWPTSRDRAPINPDTATATGHQTADEAEDADLEKMQGRGPRIELSVHATESKPDLLHGSPGHVFLVFLELGLTSFGGPVAHLGYFHDRVRRAPALARRALVRDLVALCQFLPGPAQQPGRPRHRARRAPAFWAHWRPGAGFTMPSAIAMMLFAYGLGSPRGAARVGLAAWPEDRGGRRRRAGGVGHGADALPGSSAREARGRGGRDPGPGVSLKSGAKSAPLRWVALVGSRSCATARRASLRCRSPSRATVALAALSAFFGLLLALPLAVSSCTPGIGPIRRLLPRRLARVRRRSRGAAAAAEPKSCRRAGCRNDAFLAGYGAAQAVPVPSLPSRPTSAPSWAAGAWGSCA